MQFPLPIPDAVARTLTNLLGRTVTAKRASAPSAAKSQAVAVYSTATAPAAVVCLVDLPLACSLGAALSMIPAPVAAQSARVGQIAPNLLENLGEVMNVCAALLTAGGSVRLALAQVVPPGKPLPAEAAALRTRPGGRLDLEIAISGYEAGGLAILTS
jgi:hypothetical protein